MLFTVAIMNKITGKNSAKKAFPRIFECLKGVVQKFSGAIAPDTPTAAALGTPLSVPIKAARAISGNKQHKSNNLI